MVKAPYVLLVAAASCAAFLPPLRAATKDDYRAATVGGLRETISFGRAKGTVRKVLADSQGGTIVVVGRAEPQVPDGIRAAG